MNNLCVIEHYGDEKSPKIGSRINFTINGTEFDLNKRMHINKKISLLGTVTSIVDTDTGKVYNIKVRKEQTYHRIGIHQIIHVWHTVK